MKNFAPESILRACNTSLVISGRDKLPETVFRTGLARSVRGLRSNGFS